MGEVSISYAGFAAVCFVWFAVGLVTGLWICFKRDLKDDEKGKSL